MKKILVGAIAVLILTIAQMSWADEAMMASKNSEGKVMKFTVIDVGCYVNKGAYGKDHRTCGLKCVTGGGELALMKDGKLYIPVDSGFKSAREQFVKKCDTTVKVKGTIVSNGGVNYFMISDAKN